LGFGHRKFTWATANLINVGLLKISQYGKLGPSLEKLPVRPPRLDATQKSSDALHFFFIHVTRGEDQRSSKVCFCDCFSGKKKFDSMT